MDKDETITNLDSIASRRKRIKRIKTWIIVIVLILLILPSILCVIMFCKVNSLQNQIDILMIDRYGVTYKSMDNQYLESIAKAAIADRNIIASDEEQKDYEYGDALYQSEEMDGAKRQFKKIVQYIANEVNTNINKYHELVAQVDDSKMVTQETTKEETNENQKYKSKKVYLTFDDGPSKYTEDILDILSDFNVKATFFVIGKTDDHSKEMYRKIVAEGHTLGMHSYSHRYNDIYKSIEDFDKDFTKLSDLLYDTTGYVPSIYRFPGGSSNLVTNEDISVFINYLNHKSIVYYDWNVVNGDATEEKFTTKELYQNVIAGIEVHNTSIVLMHDTDTKENTVNSLVSILKTLTEEGAEILALDEKVSPIQQVKVSSFEHLK